MFRLTLVTTILLVSCGARQVSRPDIKEEPRKDAWVWMDLGKSEEASTHEYTDSVEEPADTVVEEVQGPEQDSRELFEARETSDSIDADLDETSSYEGVYRGLEDLEGEDLRRALERITSSNYHSLSYHEASYQLVHYVDNYRGYVTGVYTGERYPPDRAESAFNVEHTWPQSKGARSEPAKSDLYHLYPTNPRANSSRGNLPFGVVVKVDKTFGDPDCSDHFPGHPEGCLSYVGKDRYGERVFEPRDAHKGNAARAIFYFAIRYHHSLTRFDNYPNNHARITEQILKEWNRLDPPDEAERLRNQRIHQLQRNYNPFIDHPEFVDRLEFVY